MPRTRNRQPLSVTQAALLLGVTREHLSRVIHGHRASRRLLARYRDLMASNFAQ